VFNGQTTLGIYGNYGRERLRPSDYPHLVDNVDFPHDQVGFFANSQHYRWLALAVEANLGRDTNYDPKVIPEVSSRFNLQPSPSGIPVGGKSRFAQVSATLRPGRGLTIENTYFYYALRDVQTNANFINNHIIRSKWNYQFTRAFSLRLIGQYNADLANPLYTSLQHAKNFDGDILFTYLVHPGTAIYVGYNSDVANFSRSLAADPYDDRLLLRTPNAFINDGRLFFVKVSYLLRF
jgi:hypothetical protein